MNVSILSHTPNPDRLAAACARGDYMDGSLVDVDLSDDEQFDAIMADAATDSLQEFLERQIRRGHFGPWEHAHITFAVEGISRACMAQFTRHRHATFDVQSMRYVNFEDAEGYVPDSFKRDDDNLVDGMGDPSVWYQENVVKDAVRKYQWLVDEGIPEEDARMVLPIGTQVNLSVTMNLRSLMHVIDMRAAGDAQAEIRELAGEMLDLAEEVAPITFQEYREHAKGASKKAP